MRSLVFWLILLGAALTGFLILLPLLGFLVVVAGGLLAMAAAVMLAVPLLQRLPWFRDRVRIERRGRFRTVRFGDTVIISYSDDSEPADSEPESRKRLSDGNVIDVEGRILSD
ncbi:MAG TPA: hypothetical protein VIL07_07475 [Symbiobacteriaceae bacterium]